MVIVDVTQSPSIAAGTFYVPLDYEVVDINHYMLIVLTNSETKTKRINYLAFGERNQRATTLICPIYRDDDGAFDTLVYEPNTFYEYEIKETINNTQGEQPGNVVAVRETGKIWFKGVDEVQYTKVPEADPTNSVYLKA